MTPMTIRRRVLVALIAVLGSLFALALVAARYYGEMLEAQRWSVHTFEVLNVLDQIQGDLSSDTGVPYCALTGNRGFIVARGSSLSYPEHYRRLVELVRDNPAQVEQASRLDQAWEHWRNQYLVPLQALCNLEPGMARPARAEVDSIAMRGIALNLAVRDQLQSMVDAEKSLLNQRQATVDRLQESTAVALGLAGLVTAVLGLLTGTSLFRAASMQDRLNRTLEDEVEQRRLAEKRLTNSEMRVRSVLDNVPDGIITIDERGIIESFNPSAEAIFGYLAEDVIGRNLSMLMPEPYRAAHNSYLERYNRTGESRIIGKRVEMVGQRSDGTRFELDLAVTEINIEGERLFTGIVRDISESRRRNAEIQRFKATLDNTLDMIYMFDPVGLNFVYVNRGARELLGYSREELLRMRASDLTPAMPEHVFRSHIAVLLAGERPWLSYETLQRRRDGSEFPAEVFLQLVRDAPEDPGLFIGIARDLTERRRMDRMKSEFISIISHELRTPLTSIRGSLGLLRGGAAGELSERSRRMIEIADHNSERLVRLINDMLDMEKIESGKMRFDMRPLAVAHLVESALEANRGFGEQYGVSFTTETTDPELKVYGDSDRLMQVMNNLLSNAAKFSPAGAAVRVGYRQRGQLVRVSVADMGPGIPTEFRGRIFERFSQADTSSTRQKSGTGLGLSIAKAILERHDGVLGFDTEEGVGSTFWFELPLWKSPSPVQEGPASSAPRILVCDDDVDVAHLLSLMLREAGYRTDVAYSAEEAKERIARHHYALMTLDIKLPGQDGVSLIRELQQVAANGDVGAATLPPIVVVTGHDEQAGHEFVGKHPVLDWLAKPIDRERLIAAAHRAMRGSKDRVRLLHVEDDADVRHVLATLVGERVEVIGAASAAEATRLLQTQRFDLVVLDVGLPDASGLELLARMEGLNAHTPVLVFSAHEPSAELSQRVAAALVKSRTSNQELLDMIGRLVA